MGLARQGVFGRSSMGRRTHYGERSTLHSKISREKPFSQKGRYIRGDTPPFGQFIPIDGASFLPTEESALFAEFGAFGAFERARQLHGLESKAVAQFVGGLEYLVQLLMVRRVQ